MKSQCYWNVFTLYDLTKHLNISNQTQYLNYSIMFYIVINSLSSAKPTVFALPSRNQDRLVFKQYRDLWDSCLVSCWIQQATHVRIPPLLQDFGNLPFCASAFTLTLIPNRDQDISQVLFITNTACQLHLFICVWSHSCVFVSFPESLYWVKQKTSPSTSRISSGFQSLNSPSKWR